MEVQPGCNSPQLAVHDLHWLLLLCVTIKPAAGKRGSKGRGGKGAAAKAGAKADAATATAEGVQQRKGGRNAGGNKAAVAENPVVLKKKKKSLAARLRWLRKQAWFPYAVFVMIVVAVLVVWLRRGGS